MKDIKRNLTMLCDYYELTMSNGYFVNGIITPVENGAEDTENAE